MALTRLQKVLALAGVASRRKAEEIIGEGRVRVNGRIVTELGTKVHLPGDKVEVDGRIIAIEKPVTVLMNKPRGVVCTVSDPEGRETVLDLVAELKARLFPVGRLDWDTSGALLLTNDGDLAYALTHPKHGVDKTYLVKIRGPVPEDILEQWRTGVTLDDGVTKPAEVHRVEVEEGYTWIEVTIREGRNRQIRRMAEATELEVAKLKRVRFAGLTIEKLAVGRWRYLTSTEEFRLKRDYLNPATRGKGKGRPNRTDDIEDEKAPRPRGSRPSASRARGKAPAKPPTKPRSPSTGKSAPKRSGTSPETAETKRPRVRSWSEKPKAPSDEAAARIKAADDKARKSRTRRPK